MKNVRFIFIAGIILLSACNHKMTCDNDETIELLKKSIKNDLIECWTLNEASKSYEGIKYDTFGNMQNDYKKFLISNLEEIEVHEDLKYVEGEDHFAKDEIILSNIVLEAYDESIDRCTCSAKVQSIHPNLDFSENVTYETQKNSENKATGKYKYIPNIKLDNKIFIKDFIDEYREE
ncbi:hypothetical protein [Flavobacterium sp. 3HN19-14]|uniref:hypothetical protein n=1 Tax=Flavobacterium sp. 3HN19-14 TaxID=3448133 RepID=UPI003EE29C3B